MRILHAIHDFLPRHRAGSEIYAFELCRELGRRHDSRVLCAEYDPGRAHGSVGERQYEGVPVVEIVNNWSFATFADTYLSPDLARRLDGVLADVRPDVLHVHNLLNLSFELPALARRRGIACVATLHDFTLVCPSGGQRVHLKEEHVCREIDTDRCRRCFAESPFHAQLAAGRAALPLLRLGPVRRLAQSIRLALPRTFVAAGDALGRATLAVTRADLDRRLAELARVVDSVDVFVAPSQALASDFERFGIPPSKLRVSRLGFVPFAPGPPRPSPRERLRVGFVGTLAWHKGVHVLLDAVRRLPPGRFAVTIAGSLETFPHYVAGLRATARDQPVRFLGAFEHGRARDVYEGLDVIVVPSLWPENAPLVIQEAFMAGVPVVAARVGGIPELVSHEENGLLYDAYSPAALAAALGRLLDEPGLLERLKSARTVVKAIAQDAAEWEAIYEGVRRARTAG